MTSNDRSKYHRGAGNRQHNNLHSGATENLDPTRLDWPTAPINMVPGTYVLRSGLKAQITDTDGMYIVGYKQTPQGRKTWRWFKNGESYGNDKWDDVVGA